MRLWSTVVKKPSMPGLSPSVLELDLELVVQGASDGRGVGSAHLRPSR